MISTVSREEGGGVRGKNDEKEMQDCMYSNHITQRVGGVKMMRVYTI